MPIPKYGRFAQELTMAHVMVARGGWTPIALHVMGNAPVAKYVRFGEIVSRVHYA